MLEGLFITANLDCSVGFVYGPNDRVGRVSFFEDLKNIIQAINKLVLLLGDFNVILHPCERSGVFSCMLSMREFSN